MTTIQGFDYPANIQFEEKDDLLVQKNEPGFFERIDTIRTRHFCAGGSIVVGLVGGLFMGINLIKQDAWFFAAGTSLPVITSFFAAIYLDSTKTRCLEDSKYRTSLLKDLQENGKNIDDLLSFINEHGIENIQKWGLRLHPDSNPLITKKIIRDLIMSDQNGGTIMDKLFRETCHSLPRGKQYRGDFENYKKGLIKFIDFLNQFNILSQSDKKEIEERIINSIVTNQNLTPLLGRTANIISHGFNTTSEMQQLIKLVEEHKKEIEESGRVFEEKFQALIKGFSEITQNEEIEELQQT